MKKEKQKQMRKDLIEVLKEFSHRLRNARNAADMTQTEAAEVLEMSRTKYQSYERGEQFPRFDEIVKLCEVFGRNYYYFFPETAIQYTDDIYTKRLDELIGTQKEYNKTMKSVLSNQEMILKHLGIEK